MWSVGHHGGKGIDDTDDSCTKRYLVSFKVIRIAASVKFFTPREQDKALIGKIIKNLCNFVNYIWEVFHDVKFFPGKFILFYQKVVMYEVTNTGLED